MTCQGIQEAGLVPLFNSSGLDFSFTVREPCHRASAFFVAECLPLRTQEPTAGGSIFVPACLLHRTRTNSRRLCLPRHSALLQAASHAHNPRGRRPSASPARSSADPRSSQCTPPRAVLRACGHRVDRRRHRSRERAHQCRRTIFNHVVPDVRLSADQLGTPPTYSPTSARTRQSAAFVNDKNRAGTTANVLGLPLVDCCACRFVIYKVDTLLRATRDVPASPTQPTPQG